MNNKNFASLCLNRPHIYVHTILNIVMHFRLFLNVVKRLIVKGMHGNSICLNYISKALYKNKDAGNYLNFKSLDIFFTK